MTTRSRNLLHNSKLGAFLRWASCNGYVIHAKSTHPYEAARLSEYTPTGDNPHMVIYRRDSGDHLTTVSGATELVKRWLKERSE